MSTESTTKRDWKNFDDKRAAIIAVLEYIESQPPTVGDRCVRDEDFARGLFEDPAIGNMSVPKGGRTIFFPAGERALKEASSLVIERPPSGNSATGKDLLRYVIGNYKYW
jgi:hypothetical protein